MFEYVLQFFLKDIHVSCCACFVEFSTAGARTRHNVELLWMSAIKRRLPSHLRLMVILLGEIEGFSFPAKKSVDSLPQPPSPFPLSAPSCRVFFRPSNVPQETATSTRAFRFSTDFSIKLRKRPEGVRRDPPPSPSTDAPFAFTLSYDRMSEERKKEKGERHRRLRGKMAFPGLYRYASGRTMSEARSISAATIVPEDIRTTLPARRDEGGAEKKGRMSGSFGEGVRNRVEATRVSQIASYKSGNSLPTSAALSLVNQKNARL